MSHREYRTRMAWIATEWNKPDRHDYYAMQIAQRILQAAGDKSVGNLEKQKIEMEMVEVSKKETMTEKIKRISKEGVARWKRGLGMK